MADARVRQCGNAVTNALPSYPATSHDGGPVRCFGDVALLPAQPRPAYGASAAVTNTESAFSISSLRRILALAHVLWDRTCRLTCPADQPLPRVGRAVTRSFAAWHQVAPSFRTVGRSKTRTSPVRCRWYSVWSSSCHGLAGPRSPRRSERGLLILRRSLREREVGSLWQVAREPPLGRSAASSSIHLVSRWGTRRPTRHAAQGRVGGLADEMPIVFARRFPGGGFEHFRFF